MGSCITNIQNEHSVRSNNMNDMKHMTLTSATSTTTATHMIQKINNNNNDGIVQYLIAGYMQELENEFLSIQIPEVIHQMILLYYFQGEYFEKLGQNIFASNGFMTISKIYNPSCHSYGNWCNTSYGHNWIDSMSNKIIKWTLKINHLGTSSPEIEFGIVSTDNCQYNDFTRNRHDILCSFANDGDYGNYGHYMEQYRYNDLMEDEYSHSSSSDEYRVFDNNNNQRKRIWNIFNDTYKQKQIYIDDYSIPFGSGDKLSITLNLKERTLVQEINDNEKKILCESVEINKNIKYKLAVSMFSPQNSITFIDYQQYN